MLSGTASRRAAWSAEAAQPPGIAECGSVGAEAAAAGRGGGIVEGWPIEDRRTRTATRIQPVVGAGARARSQRTRHRAARDGFGRPRSRSGVADGLRDDTHGLGRHFTDRRHTIALHYR